MNGHMAGCLGEHRDISPFCEQVKVLSDHLAKEGAEWSQFLMTAMRIEAVLQRIKSYKQDDVVISNMIL